MRTRMLNERNEAMDHCAMNLTMMMLKHSKHSFSQSGGRQSHSEEETKQVWTIMQVNKESRELRNVLPTSVLHVC